MKHKLFLMVVWFITIGTHAQEDVSDLVKIGDHLTISAPSSNNYKFIDVPRKNFIIKRGGIANVGSLENLKVTVTKISYDDNTQVTFKRSDGRKFFKAYRTLKANLNGAITSGELKIATDTNKDSHSK